MLKSTVNRFGLSSGVHLQECCADWDSLELFEVADLVSIFIKLFIPAEVKIIIILLINKLIRSSNITLGDIITIVLHHSWSTDSGGEGAI